MQLEAPVQAMLDRIKGVFAHGGPLTEASVIATRNALSEMLGELVDTPPEIGEWRISSFQ